MFKSYWKMVQEKVEKYDFRNQQKDDSHLYITIGLRRCGL